MNYAVNPLSIQFVSDDPEKSVQTFLLTAAVRLVTSITFFIISSWLIGCRYALQTREHDFSS